MFKSAVNILLDVEKVYSAVSSLFIYSRIPAGYGNFALFAKTYLSGKFV